MLASEVLRKAAERYRRGDGWTTGTHARDAQGNSLVHPLAGLATTWCCIGMISRCGDDPYIINQARIMFANRLKAGYVSDWNDAPGRTKDQVIEKLETVAGQLEAEGK